MKSQALVFLERLHELMPSKVSHNLRIEKGRLTVRLFHDGKTVDVALDDDEMDKEPRLAELIAEEINWEVKK